MSHNGFMQYMIEIWKAAGMDMTRVEFLNASDEINKRPNEYWTLVMDIARQNTLARITKCCQIMGRSESDNLSASQIFYPCMQCADIFFLKVASFLQLTSNLRSQVPCLRCTSGLQASLPDTQCIFAAPQTDKHQLLHCCKHIHSQL